MASRSIDMGKRGTSPANDLHAKQQGMRLRARAPEKEHLRLDTVPRSSYCPTAMATNPPEGQDPTTQPTEQQGQQPPPIVVQVPAQPAPPQVVYVTSAAPAAVGTKTNGFSIASMVLGILWLYWVGSILALIFGYIARKQIRASQGQQGGDGMAIAGIVLGWIGVGVLLLLIVLGVGIGLSGG